MVAEAWDGRNVPKKLDALIRDTEAGIASERKTLGWMAETASRRDLAAKVRAIAALEARLATLQEARALFTGR